MKTIRVVIADDSLTVRKRLARILESDPEFAVVGEAENGREAVELCRRLRPDVITIDMMMPLMNGVVATEYIMAYCPAPILVVSASINRGEVLKTFDAIAAGAVDVLEKPSGAEPQGEWERRFRSTLKIVSHVKPIMHPRGRLRVRDVGPAAAPIRSGSSARPEPKAVSQTRRLCAVAPQRAEVLAIGASTGGPAAMADILSRIPEDFPLPILLVVHMVAGFADGFVEWLDGVSNLRVQYAVDGEPLPGKCAGKVVMAPPDRHLEVFGQRLHLTNNPERHSCRPSVDVLFESVAEEYGPRAIGCLLTGMGTDGAGGLLRIRSTGGFTIAQDQATSVVFGMPREAIRIGAAQLILPLSDICPALCALVRSDASVREST